MTVDTCALCGDDSAPVLVIGDESRTYLSACALCLIRAFDTLTGYKFEKMMMQYERLKQYHAAQKKLRSKGVTSPAKGATFAELLDNSTSGK